MTPVTHPVGIAVVLIVGGLFMIVGLGFAVVLIRDAIRANRAEGTPNR